MESTIELATAPSQESPSKPKPAPMTEKELESRYVEQLNAMLDDACDRQMMPVFVDIVAWKLAVIAHQCGPAAAGDVFRRFGEHLRALAQRAEAQREAEEEKRAGRQPH